MNGKHHVMCTNVMLISSAVCYVMNDRIINDKKALKPIMHVNDIIWQAIGFHDRDISIEHVLLFFSFLLVATIGTLFVDCDSKTSTIGRFIYVPVEHRTWMHAIYAPVIFMIIWFSNQLLVVSLWFAIGWFLHEFMDSFSVCGVSYFYPFVGYRHFGNSGAKVKRGIHIFRIYRSGEKSETLFVSFVVFLCVAVIVYVLL